MTDRELLELAAKAAGIEYWVVRFAPRANPIEKLHTAFGGETVEWNPLESDADALRLAVKLDMLCDFCGDATAAFGNTWHYEPKGDDPYAATRRAIVRAAAEIGKAMEDQ